MLKSGLMTSNNDNTQGPDEPKLRVLQAGSTAYRGGVTNAVKTLCASLRKLGHEVALLTDGGELTQLEQMGIECQVTDLSTNPRRFLKSVLLTRRLIRRFRPDVIHVHGRGAALRLTLAGRSADWFTLHSTHLTHRAGFCDWGPIRRYLSPWGRNFFVLNELTRPYLEKEFGVSPEAVFVVPNGVDCDQYRMPSSDERATARRDFDITPDKTFVVFVGRLHPAKQPSLVVDAAVQARASGRADLAFAIVGDGELQESLAQQIEIAQVQESCQLHSWMDPLKAYFAADLVVMPSEFEGYGLVAAEAISTGCPVLRTRTGGTADMIMEGVTGFACDVSGEAFSKRLFEILEVPEQLTAMRQPARDFATKHLDVLTATRRVTEAYRDRLAPGRRR